MQGVARRLELALSGLAIASILVGALIVAAPSPRATAAPRAPAHLDAAQQTRMAYVAWKRNQMDSQLAVGGERSRYLGVRGHGCTHARQQRPRAGQALFTASGMHIGSTGVSLRIAGS